MRVLVKGKAIETRDIVRIGEMHKRESPVHIIKFGRLMEVTLWFEVEFINGGEVIISENPSIKPDVDKFSEVRNKLIELWEKDKVETIIID